MHTKLSIPAREKEIDLSIEEPLTNQEEEDYELNLYISTFVSEETPAKDTGQLKIIIIPPTLQREETQAQQLVTILVEESLVLTEYQGGEIDTENPEYAVIKQNICKLSKEIAASRKRKITQEQEQGKGKRKIIIVESSKDKEELAAMACAIIKDATANKVLVKT